MMLRGLGELAMAVVSRTTSPLKVWAVAVAVWGLPALADEATLQQAVRLYNDFQPELAVSALKPMVADPSESPSLRARAGVYLGLCQASLADTGAAVASFRAAFAFDPTVPVPPETPPDVKALSEQARADVRAALAKSLDVAAQQIASAAQNKPTAPECSEPGPGAAPPFAPVPAPTEPAVVLSPGNTAEPTHMGTYIGGELGLTGFFTSRCVRACISPSLGVVLEGGNDFFRRGGTLYIALGDSVGLGGAFRMSLGTRPKPFGYSAGFDVGLVDVPADGRLSLYGVAHLATLTWEVGPTLLELHVVNVGYYGSLALGPNFDLVWLSSVTLGGGITVSRLP
jgi:hypothetical protein